MWRRNTFLLLAGFAVACSSSSASTTAPDRSSSTPSTTSTTVAPTTSAPPAQPVTIAFAGDINFEGNMGARLAADPSTAIGPFSDVLGAADLAVGNLETAIATGGSPENKQFTFRAPPSAVDALRAAGFDVVSMANNHGRDYGAAGLEETLAVKDAQPDHFIIGVGHNEADAYTPFVATVRGQRIAIIAATQVLDGELVGSWTATLTQPGLASAKREDRLVQAVHQARSSADTVIVYLHWGVELVGCPTDDQRSLAAALADAGADIVIGGHAHRLLGAGFLGTTFVGYGLGNFDFNALSAVTASTGVVRVTVTGRHVDAYDFVPGVIRRAVATPVDGDEATQAIDAWNGLRDCTGLTP